MVEVLCQRLPIEFSPNNSKYNNIQQILVTAMPTNNSQDQHVRQTCASMHSRSRLITCVPCAENMCFYCNIDAQGHNSLPRPSPSYPKKPEKGGHIVQLRLVYTVYCICETIQALANSCNHLLSEARQMLKLKIKTTQQQEKNNVRHEFLVFIPNVKCRGHDRSLAKCRELLPAAQ